MKPPFRLVGRYVDSFGTTWEIFEGKATPSLAPKPAPSPFDPIAAMVVELEEAIQREAEQKRCQPEKGDVPWE